ncbi:FtsX-like permease family protein [Paraclostridium ghonii]|uniref:ABC transport system permease protein n=1 Tax=Paraclostridium ghonii TaxID=29358 RepID=A0ABU0MZJ7_9FIRM|nr:ABC transporter permease [Paeniclostridium ghonii]MDQ0556149.1 putative ABC transport system permease protein [Paeniclostridium ghonii]
MNIMSEYTYHHLRKNKRHTISIIVAITIASALLCSLCIFVHTLWKAKVTTEIEKSGYWHGELWDSISGDKLKYVTENPEVETTMVKGQWITAKLSNTKRPYLLMRDADANFWADMGYQDNIMKGRLPQKPGEIVLSKLFFLDNPSYKIGDKLTLPIGDRMLGDKTIETQGYKQSGETFNVIGTNAYTIVGEIDSSGSSAYPGYIAMGYLDHSQIKPKDELTVYMRLKKPRKIYETLPKIAKYTGLKQDEYGKYKVLYNTPLLNLYGISDKNDENTQVIVIIAMVIIMTLLVMGTFILIIYNGFSLSANSRIKQLGILKSLGATPKQIRHSVIYEGFLLWIIQLPICIMIGYLFSYMVVFKINEILSATEDFRKIHISFSWVVVVFAIITSLITVLISAYIPARKVAKVSAIVGIRQNNNKVKIKKQKFHPIINKIFGIEGELAKVQFLSNKRSLRTAVLSLSMCFSLIVGYMSIVSILNLAESKDSDTSKYDMTVNLNIIDDPNKDMINKIISLYEVKDSVIRRQVRTATYVTSEQESDVFSKSGGFDGVSIKYNVSNENGKYRIITNLVGLSDESFKKYCKEIGIDSEKYYQDGVPTGILLDSTYHTLNDSKVAQKIPLLNVKEGDELTLNEKVENDMNTNYKFNAKVGAVTDISPGNQEETRYSIDYIVPMSTYQKIVSNFMQERMAECNSMSIDLVVGDEANPSTKKELTKICSSYLGCDDFRIWSLLEDKNHEVLVQKATAIGVFATASMIGLIGTFNAFSTISNNLRLRKREFAILRSVGLTPKGLNKILMIEGLFFVVTPIIVSIPIVSFICWYMLRLTPIILAEFIPVFPVGVTLMYTIIIIVSIFLSYYISSTCVKKSNVVESIKNEIV